MILTSTESHDTACYNIEVYVAVLDRNRILPYSGKFSLGANFRDFRGQTCFHENKNCEKMN